LKQKIIEVKRSKYGDLYGLVNGKFRFQSSSSEMDMSKIRGHVNINLESHYGTVYLKLPDYTFSTTQATGWWDLGQVYYPYFPNLKSNFFSFGLFVRNHWRDGLAIGTIIWAVFKELGILAIPTTRFFKL